MTGAAPAPEQEVAAALGAFDLPGPVVAVRSLATGHIHATYDVDVTGPSDRRGFVAQRLNEHVFADLDAVMGNLVRILDHLAQDPAAPDGADAARPTVTLVPTRAGGAWSRAADGGAWRVFVRIPGVSSRTHAASDDDAVRIGRAFGDFVARLADLPDPPLRATIPGFHDFDARVRDLEAAAARPAERREAVDDVGRALELAQRVAAQRRRAGVDELERRIVHNDTKVDNLLCDDVTGEPRCVVDLDTVMPGCVLDDLGELCRTAATPAAEDEPDLDRVTVDQSRLAALTRGFVAGCGGLLTPAERAALPLGPPSMAAENGLRFLADHLGGDRYFRVHRPGQNRDRARAQLVLAERFLECADVVADAARG